MKNSVVARNYAEALYGVAVAAAQVERFGDLLDAVAGAVAADPTVHAVLMNPRVAKKAKSDLLARALREIAPAQFVKFLAAVVHRGRQGLLGEISEAYQELVDQHLDRVHASVVTAHPTDRGLEQTIARRLTEVVGRTVVPHFRTDPSLIGGLVVRVGDRVFDGSLRRRIRMLRERMLLGR